MCTDPNSKCVNVKAASRRIIDASIITGRPTLRSVIEPIDGWKNEWIPVADNSIGGTFVVEG